MFVIASRASRLFSRVLLRIHHPFAQFQDKKGTIKMEQMKFNRESAVWACQIIKAIWSAEINNQKQITQNSLREQILKLTIPNFNFSQESRNYVLKMFTQGILLNQTVFNQKNIEQGKQGASSKATSQFLLPFIFCPNLLVTKELFRILLFKRYHRMTFGGYGISKTASIVLFHQLSSIVNKYLYSAFSDPQQQSSLQELKGKQLIFDVPKLFYWNMAFEGQNSNIPTEKTIKQSLLLQATELSNNEKSILSFPQFQSLYNFADKMRKLYEEKNIVTKIAIDQLNFTASLMRRYNVYISQSQDRQKQYNNSILALEQKFQKEKRKKIQKILERKIDKQYQQYKKWELIDKELQKKQKEQLYEPAKTLRGLMRSILKISMFSLFNSSMNIELDILKAPADFRMITLGLHDHNELLQEQIPFSDNLSQLWGRNDFHHYFWFEVQKRLVSKGFTEAQLKRFKGIFYDKVKDQKTPKYFRLIYIRQAFDKNKPLFDFPAEIKQFSDQEMEARCSQIIQYLYFFSLKSCQDRIEYFFKKVSKKKKQTRKTFVLMLNNVAKQQQSKGNGDKFMQINIQEVDQQYFLGNKTTQNFLHSKAYDKEFIHFSLQKLELIAIFRWTPDEYLEINEQQQLRRQYPSLPGTQLFKIFLQKNRYAGFAYQNALIEVLSIPKTVFTYQTYQTKKRILMNPLLFKNMQIENSTDFLRFRKLQKQNNQNKNCIWINFSKMLTMAKGKPFTYIFGTPYSLSQQEWRYYPDNPTTNFAIVSYEEQQSGSCHFQIHSFDVTLISDEKPIRTRISKAQQIFKDMLESEIGQVELGEKEKEQYFKEEYLKEKPQYLQIMKTKIKLIHSIICQQKVVEKMSIIQQENPDFTINFIPIESINVECPDKIFHQHVRNIKDITLHLVNKEQMSSKKQ